MDELLTSVLDAHGGLDNWSSVSRLTAKFSLGGVFWGARGWPEAQAEQTAVLEARREHVSLAPFPAAGQTSVLDVGPERVVITDANGRVLDERTDPRSSYPPQSRERTTPWDAIQVAYFAAAAIWNYFTEPFVFTYPGVEAWEIDPWQENGASWRRLAVRFPPTIANHNSEQVFYYDEEFMQRRMDYSPDVTGNPPIAHYTHDPKRFDGFVFPTRRLVHLRDADGIADQSFAPITIDVSSVAVERA